MSRVGKQPIIIPETVEVKIEGSSVLVKGPKGELRREVRPEIKVSLEGGRVLVSPLKETKQTKALWGLYRTLIFNMIKGAKEGFEKRLKIEGVGYKASLEGENLVLLVGFSHPIKINQVPGIKFLVEKNIIIVNGFDKQLVGQVAAKIRAVKPPEPYKGKGIRYENETVRRKAGKKAATTTG